MDQAVCRVHVVVPCHAQVPVGHIPRSMTVYIRGDLTRRLLPGNVVTLSGVFLPIRYTGYRALTAGLTTDTCVRACVRACVH